MLVIYEKERAGRDDLLILRGLGARRTSHNDERDIGALRMVYVPVYREAM